MKILHSVFPWVIFFNLKLLSVLSQPALYKVSMPSGFLCAYSNKQSDFFSYTGNQANLARIKGSGIGFFSEQRFSLKNNPSHQLIVVVDAKKINLGIKFDYTGFSLFNSSSLGIASAKKLSDKVDIGIQFNFISEKAAFYTRNVVLNFESGILLHLTPTLNAGIHLYNPAALFFSSYDVRKVPTVYKFGLGYDASDDFHVSAEILKEENLPVVFQTGFQYKYKKIFFAKFCYVSNIQSVCFGAGVSYKKLRTGLYGSSHPQLGITPGILLLYNNNSDKQ